MSSLSVSNSTPQHNTTPEPFAEAFLLVTQDSDGIHHIQETDQATFAGRVNNVLFFDYARTRWYCHFDTETFEAMDYVQWWVAQRTDAARGEGTGENG